MANMITHLNQIESLRVTQPRAACRFLRLLMALLLCAAGTFPAISQGCTLIPEHVRPTVTKLVNAASEFGIARVVDAKKSGRATTYTLEYENVLWPLQEPGTKAQRGKRFVVHGIPSGSAQDERQNGIQDFQAHSSIRFWAGGVAGQVVQPSCSVVPQLELGARYLAFPDMPYSLRSFERLQHEDDLWLRAVLTARSIRLGARSDLPTISLNRYVADADVLIEVSCDANTRKPGITARHAQTDAGLRWANTISMSGTYAIVANCAKASEWMLFLKSGDEESFDAFSSKNGRVDLARFQRTYELELDVGRETHVAQLRDAFVKHCFTLGSEQCEPY